MRVRMKYFRTARKLEEQLKPMKVIRKHRGPDTERNKENILKMQNN